MLILFKFKDEVLFIFKVVEEMLVFGDCVVLFLVEWGKCFDVVLFSYIYKYICYLGVVWENGIEGIVYVQFVVEKDGSVSQVKIFWDIGGGCGREVEWVVAEMLKWLVLGKQWGWLVCVQFNLFVKFKF